MLVLGDQGGHALPGLIDGSRGLGGGAGDAVDVRSAEVVSLVRPRRTDRKVVVKSSDGARVVGQHSLSRQEWVEGLNWSALQRERSPLGCERPERFTLDGSLNVVDRVVLDSLDRLYGLDRLYRLYKRLDGVMSMLSCLFDMMGPVCAMLSMVGSVGGMFSRLLAMLAMLGMLVVVVVVVMIVTISQDQREHH